MATQDFYFAHAFRQEDVLEPRAVEQWRKVANPQATEKIELAQGHVPESGDFHETGAALGIEPGQRKTDNRAQIAEVTAADGEIDDRRALQGSQVIDRRVCESHLAKRNPSNLRRWTEEI